VRIKADLHFFSLESEFYGLENPGRDYECKQALVSLKPVQVERRAPYQRYTCPNEIESFDAWRRSRPHRNIRGLTARTVADFDLPMQVLQLWWGSP